MSAELYTFLAALLAVGIGWWWSYVKPPPAHDHQPVPTFCVRGVPLDWNSDDLRSFLAKKHDSADPDVRSLAVEVHGRSQTATVSFRNVPYDLQIPLPATSDNRSRVMTLDRDFLGITTLYAPPPQDHKVDLIAISGLGGHAFGSFKQRGGEHMWLRDSVPKHITGEGDNKPIARVMIYGYDSALPQSNNFQNLEDLGTAFHSHLRWLAMDGASRPIVFIAHSLGGLIVKQTLISLSRSTDELDQKLIRAVYGIAFFGVPHDGMDISSLIAMVEDGPNRFLLESIGPFSSQILTIQQREFLEALRGRGESEIVCFFETRRSPTAQKNESGRWEMTGPDAVLVSKASATHCRPWENGPQHICAIDRTHSEMVKFGPEDHEYEKALGRIRSLVFGALKARRRPLRPRLSQEDRDCLQSLAFPQMHDRAKDVETATKGTCQWLLEHEMYKNWAASNSGLLWVKGKPGSGKSTLLKYALDIQEETLSYSSNLVLSFFFHGRGDKLQNTPLGFFRSIAHQVLSQVPSALSNLVDEFQRRREQIGEPGQKWQWHPKELLHFFESCLPKMLESHSVWLFVDALDECGKDNAVELFRWFKTLLQTLPNTARRCRICVTCRHYPILDQVCEFQICPEHENARDISTYVQGQLSNSRERTSTVPALITNRASGVFMWARLVVKEVLDLEREGAGPKKIKAAVYSIPQDLDKLYQELIKSMKPASLKLIRWICFATRPLSIDELRWAMVIEVDCPYRSLQACRDAEDVLDSEQMEKQLRTLSHGLAEVTSDMQTVQFIHQSVKDFFMEKGLLTLVGNSMSPDTLSRGAHFQLSRTCIRYLAMEEIGQSTDSSLVNMKSDFPLLNYATTSWVAHTKQSDAKDAPQDDLLVLFAWPSNVLVDLWTRIYKAMDRYSRYCPAKGTTLLHIVAKYEILGTLQDILDKISQTAVDIDSKDELGLTPLHRAAGEGHEAVVRLLLESGAAVDSKDEHGVTSVYMAALEGHEAVVRLLLESGAAIDSKDEDGWVLVYRAAGLGHKAVVRLLLESRAAINSKDEYGWMPVHIAALGGHEAVMRLLLESGAAIDSKGEYGQMPVHQAAIGGNKAVVRLLLEEGAAIEVQNGEGQTPLHQAARYGHEAVVRLLLEEGAAIEAQDKKGQTPLHRAARYGHEAVVRLLLEEGAAIEVQDKEGQTPLHKAAEYSREAVVRLLLEEGAAIEAQDKKGQTPLHRAAESDREAVVRLLETSRAEAVRRIVER